MLAYVVGFSIIIKQGYQSTVPAAGSVALKVKGVASMKSGADVKLFDATDLTTYENGGVFIATALMRTEQARGTCLGTSASESCDPSNPASCVEGAFSRSGMQTGRCVASAAPGASATRRCEIRGWCPGEPEVDVAETLSNVGNFTVFMRTQVEFPGITDANGATFEVSNANGTEPTEGWNLFTLDELLAMGGVSLADDDVASEGADLLLTVYYDCDLDRALEECTPRIPFDVTRTDTADSSLSRGYNARWLSAAGSSRAAASPPPDPDATYDADAETRLLVKASGPRIRVQIAGQGRRFDMGRLTTTLGAGLALCGLATAIVDALLLYALPLRKTFKGLKYDTYGADEEGGCDALALGGEGGGVARVNDEDEQAEPLIR